MTLALLRRNHATRGDRPQERTTPEKTAQDRTDGWSRWSPWAEFTELHERLGRLLSQMSDPTPGGLAPLGPGWRPAADLEETDDAYLVELELPGVAREDICVEFGAGELAVSGEVKRRERVGFLRTRTRPVGRFDYRVHLPADVDRDQVSASLADGVLTVRVPKTATARRRRIPISS